MSAAAPLLPGLDARPHEPLVGAWFASLATMAGREHTREEAARREIALFVPALAEAFPVDAFTQRSLRYVAALAKRWTYATIHDALRQWWAENQPATQLLDTPEIAHLTVEERLWVKYWQRERPAKADEEADIRQRGAWQDPTQLPLARLASMVRTYAPRAWAHISGDPGAVERRPPTEDEIAAVRIATAEAAAACQMPTVPAARPAWAQIGRLGARREPDRPVGAISPERLAADRAALGIGPATAPPALEQPHYDDEEPPPPEPGDYA